MNRIVLINNGNSCLTLDKIFGEGLLHDKDVSWGGHMIIENTGKLCANWIINSDFDEFYSEFNNKEIDGYAIKFYKNGNTPNGGQTEIEV